MVKTYSPMSNLVKQSTQTYDDLVAAMKAHSMRPQPTRPKPAEVQCVQGASAREDCCVKVNHSEETCYFESTKICSK